MKQQSPVISLVVLDTPLSLLSDFVVVFSTLQKCRSPLLPFDALSLFLLWITLEVTALIIYMRDSES